jgi:hypothetical protein
MTTVRVTTECALRPERVLQAACDFGPQRCQVWPAVRAEHLIVHELGETTADATEGTPAGIGINWERCRYDWSEPGCVTATVTDSNVYARPSSFWQLTATPATCGSRVEMVWQRTFRRNPRGLLFGTLFRVIGRPIFGNYARQVIANLEQIERRAASRGMRLVPHLLCCRTGARYRGTSSGPVAAAGRMAGAGENGAAARPAG